jgi:hypothetical protein
VHVVSVSYKHCSRFIWGRMSTSPAGGVLTLLVCVVCPQAASGRVSAVGEVIRSCRPSDKDLRELQQGKAGGCLR